MPFKRSKRMHCKINPGAFEHEPWRVIKEKHFNSLALVVHQSRRHSNRIFKQCRNAVDDASSIIPAKSRNYGMCMCVDVDMGGLIRGFLRQ